jgi:hypothetical protein
VGGFGESAFAGKDPAAACTRGLAAAAGEAAQHAKQEAACTASKAGRSIQSVAQQAQRTSVVGQQVQEVLVRLALQRDADGGCATTLQARNSCKGWWCHTLR